MKGVPIDEVLDFVGGYTCANDVGMHDFRHADRGAMLRVKGHDGFLPLGPELVPAADFDPTSYTLRTYLNGDVVQEATADDLLFSVAYQLADLCRLITLEPGDVILSGTPANSRPMQPGRPRRGRDLRASDASRTRSRSGTSTSRAPASRCRSRPRRSTSHSRSPRTRPSGWLPRGSRRDRVPPHRPRLPSGRGRRRGGRALAGPVRRSRPLRDGGRALLSCDDEPYSIELARARRRATTTPGSSSPAAALWTTPATICGGTVSPGRSRRARLFLARPRRPRRAGDALSRPQRAARWPQHARRSTTVHPGAPRKLGHVNCLSGRLRRGVRFYTDVLGMARRGPPRRRGHLVPGQHGSSCDGSDRQGSAHFHHLAFDTVDIGQMRDLLDHLARHGRWLGWGPARHGVGGNIASYVRVVEEECFVELYCDMEQLQDDHVPRLWPDDRYSSNTWGRCRRAPTSASTPLPSSGSGRAARCSARPCRRPSAWCP